MIDRPTIERIKDAADIVDVVREFVSLKKVGANYRGLCPFHNDHTPSFYVSPARRTCHCFVCGEGGDSVGFIMKHEQLSYPDALRWLASRYHIQIQERELSDGEKKENAERESMYIVNEWAADYFHDILENDIDGRAIGMQYFRQRGVRDDIIRKFRLGFCLNDRHAMSREALKKGFQPEFLTKTGLCYTRENGDAGSSNGELVDRFAGRVMFPWIGLNGKVVAFGGRVLDSRTKGVNQKYVNSPDSTIYHKDHELYGIFQAKKAIAKEDCVYMVEGYTDVISMHQCGIENVVANSGTALSEHQIRLLHRFTQNIILLYDGDAAGIKAALRGTDMLLRDGMNVKVMLLPDGDDPDSFAKKHSAEEFRQYIEDNKTDFIEFKTRVKLDGITDPVKRAEAISSIIESISYISDPIIRAVYIQDCTSRLGISQQNLIAKLNEFIRIHRSQERTIQSPQPNTQHPSPNTQTPSPNTQNPTPNTQNPSPNTQNTTPTTQNPSPLPPLDMPPMGIDDEEPPAAPPITVDPLPVLPFWKTRPLTAIPDLIMRLIIKYGGMVIYDNVETDDGQVISLTLAQYVSFDLGQDSLAFAEPLYNQILAEAVEECGKVQQPDTFDSEKYFTMHADESISAFAIEITQEKAFLSKSLEFVMTPELLVEKIQHLLLDYRNEYIVGEIRRLTQEIAKANSEIQRHTELLTQLQEMQKMRTAIAKRIGSSVLGHRR